MKSQIQNELTTHTDRLAQCANLFDLVVNAIETKLSIETVYNKNVKSFQCVSPSDSNYAYCIFCTYSTMSTVQIMVYNHVIKDSPSVCDIVVSHDEENEDIGRVNTTFNNVPRSIRTELYDLSDYMIDVVDTHYNGSTSDETSL